MTEHSAENAHRPPYLLFRCSVPGCGAARYQMGAGRSAHRVCVATARILGWTGDDSTTCLCANHDIKCPEHSEQGAR